MFDEYIKMLIGIIITLMWMLLVLSLIISALLFQIYSLA